MSRVSVTSGYLTKSNVVGEDALTDKLEQKTAEGVGGAMLDATGRCLCGRVAYTAIGEPLTTFLCHCRDCQHYTGSAFEAGMIFPADLVSVSGELTHLPIAAALPKLFGDVFARTVVAGS